MQQLQLVSPSLSYSIDFSCKVLIVIFFFDFFYFHSVSCWNGKAHYSAGSLFLLVITRSGITTTFMFHSFLISLLRSKYLSFFLLSLIFILRLTRTAKRLNQVIIIKKRENLPFGKFSLFFTKWLLLKKERTYHLVSSLFFVFFLIIITWFSLLVRVRWSVCI